MAEHIPPVLNAWVKEDNKVYFLSPHAKQASAKQWVNGYYGRISNIEPILYDNIPFRGLRITGSYRDGKSSCAIQLELPNGYLIEARIERFLEVIKYGGIDPEGNLGGAFVFSAGSGSVRLVGVGSPRYEACMDINLVKGKPTKLPRIHVKKLVPGTYYKSSSPTSGNELYLGRVGKQFLVVTNWDKETSVYELSKGFRSYYSYGSSKSNRLVTKSTVNYNKPLMSGVEVKIASYKERLDNYNARTDYQVHPDRTKDIDFSEWQY